MKSLEKSIKRIYVLFISTIIVVIIAVLLIIQNSISLQKYDAHLINKSGKQRMLSESILKTAFSIAYNPDETLKSASLKSLKKATDALENSHKFLHSKNKQEENSATIDSLLKSVEPYLKEMIAASRNITNSTDPQLLKKQIEIIGEAGPYYLSNANALVTEYQKSAENHLENLIRTIYFLAFIAALILIGEFLFVMVPALKQIFRKNNELLKVNNDLAVSQNKIKETMSELTKLKTDLEIKEAHNKIFIEQAPTAIAMLDNNMCYMAVSKRWITDYKMEGQEIIGRSHYEVFPEVGEEGKKNHQKCLNGAIDTCDEVPFIRADGSVQWIYWDVRPWFRSQDKIGGLLMHTGDLTKSKEKDFESIRIQNILDKTDDVARMGTWEVDLIKNKVFWSRMIRVIHDAPDNYVPELRTSIDFFKEGESRDIVRKVVKEAIEHGTSYDVEVELVTLKGDTIWTRAIGQAEMINGKCIRLYGVFQDINHRKASKLALDEAHSELKAIFNSRTIAIVSTDADGIITHFNHGAETLTGYSASEMIGLKRPIFYHLREELDRFRIDIARLYNKNPKGFSAQLELSKHNAYDTREWHYLRKDGSTIPVQLTLTSIKDENDKLIGYLGVSTDASEKRIVQDELLRKNQLLNFAEEITLMGHWQWDNIADKVQWSNNLYNIFKLDREIDNLKFDTYFKFVHPDDRGIVTDYFENALANKGIHRITHRIIAGDGELKTTQLLAESITNDKDEVIEMIGTCQDITEQIMAENKFRGLLESAPDAMVIVNEKGAIQLINNQAEKLFGYALEELFGKPVEILIPKGFTDIKDQLSDQNGFFSNPKVKSIRVGKENELTGINKHKKEIPIQISLSPLQTEEGLLLSAAIRDITVQKLSERKILEAKERLEILANKLTIQNKQLADFAHITSHNLRAPVSNLNALLDFYNESESDQEKIELFSKFEKVINHLTLTLNTLVEALKTKNVTSNDNEDVHFDDVFNITKEILYGQIVKTGAVIISDFSKINKINYNKIYLESIFLNLVGNAIKYRSETRTPEIFIESKIEDGHIKLKIKDNGMGIDLQRHGHKLFGLNKVFHRHPDANGVGLFMTKVQIEAMGGSISATSAVNEGTTFTINFN